MNFNARPPLLFKSLLASSCLALVASAQSGYTYKLPTDTFDTNGLVTSIGAYGNQMSGAASYAVDPDHSLLTGISFGWTDDQVAGASFAPQIYIYGAAANSPDDLVQLASESFVGAGLGGGVLHYFGFSTPVDVSEFPYFFAVVDYGPNSGLNYPLGLTEGVSDSSWISLSTGDDVSAFQLLSFHGFSYTAVYHVHAVSAIPEPSTYALLAGAIIGGVVILRRKRA